MRRRSRRLGWWLAGLVLVAGGITYLAYLRDIEAARGRVVSGSRVVETSRGPVELAEWGDGPAVLVVHGAGGGYDQGRLVAQAFGGEGFHWIAPSRFGYLRSPLPRNASTPAQADAFAALLDALGVERAAILAISGGAPPSLQFALRHPERTSALVLLSSAPYTPLRPEDQRLPIPAWLYQALFSSNFPYWVLEKVAKRRLEVIFDVKPDLRARLTDSEEMLVDGLVDAFQPVASRTDGLRNEAAAIDPQTSYPLAEITAPTLVVHAHDDGVNPYRIGEYTAANIPGAAFWPLEDGGHLLLGHQAEVRARINAFLHEHAPDRTP